MPSRNDTISSQRVGISVVVRHSEYYSPGISLLELERKERIDVRAFASDGSYYKMSAQLKMASNRTKVIHFLPQILFINRVGRSLALSQYNTESEEWLHPDDPPKQLKWHSGASNELLRRVAMQVKAQRQSELQVQASLSLKLESMQMTAPFSTWPWENLGSYKYLLYAPFVAKTLYSLGGSREDQWCLHLLIICSLRGLVHQLWFTFTNMIFLTRNRRVVKEGVDFKQIDEEWDWDNFLILQVLIGAMVFYCFPSTGNLPQWDWRGAMMALLLHVVISEPLFYWVHRNLHEGQLFTDYH